MTAAAIARRAHELRSLYIGLNAAVMAMSHPSLPLLRFLNEITGGAHPMADVPFTVGGSDTDPEEILINARECLIDCTRISGDVRRDDVLSIAMTQGAVRLGAMIDQAAARDPKSPLLEFTRHFRNACAHNGRWNFRNGEPRYPAEHRGKALDASMHGEPALWDWVTPSRYVLWLEDVRDHFAGAAQAAGEDPEVPFNKPPVITG